MNGIFLMAFAVAASAATPAKSGDIGAGKTLFSAKCATCHGKDGKGSPAMAKMFKVDAAKLDLSHKDIQAKKDEDLKTSITKGKNKMPSFAGKLKEDEIDGLLALIRSLAAPKPKDPGKEEAPKK